MIEALENLRSMDLRRRVALRFLETGLGDEVALCHVVEVDGLLCTSDAIVTGPLGRKALEEHERWFRGVGREFWLRHVARVRREPGRFRSYARLAASAVDGGGFQPFWDRMQVQDIARMTFPGVLGTYGWLGLLRKAGSRSFSRADLAELQALVPSQLPWLAQANALDEADGCDPPLRVVCDAERRIVATTDETWSGRLAPLVQAAIDAGRTAHPFVSAGVAARVERLHGPEAARWVVSFTRSAAVTARPIDTLSERQRDVARLLSAGATYDEIGTELGISAHTVKSHVSEVYRRLGVRSRGEVAAILAK